MIEIEGCQRWRTHRSSYRPIGEPIDINGDGYFAKIVDKFEAKDFVVKHHYSKSYVASRLDIGLFRDSSNGEHELCGVAGFSVPMSQNVIPYWLKSRPEQGVDLGRFVLLDDVPANGETWFLKKSFGLLLESEKTSMVDSVMATSDPLVRVNSGGEIVMPGHVGTIYQAHNGNYLGRTTKRTKVSGFDGNIIPDRTWRKIVADKGESYAYQKVLDTGVPAKEGSETWKEFCIRAKKSLPKIRHPGNHVYAWAIGDNRRDRKETLHRIGEGHNFPKEVEVL